jgi:NADPH:quinone reductase-like Zn-dependent oxidoreductase
LLPTRGLLSAAAGKSSDRSTATAYRGSFLGANLRPLNPLLLTGRGITLGSISVGSRAHFEAMNRTIAMHGLRSVIDRTFPFAEANAGRIT